ATGAAPGIKSIWNSTWRTGGRPGSSSGKTSGNSLTIEARDMDTKLLSAPESNNILTRCWFRRNVPVTIFGSRARSYVMQSTFLTQGTVSSTPIVFSWGGSIGPEGFWPSILLLTVIIVVVAIVVAVILVVVAAIIGIVVVVVGVPSIIKLSFVITGSLHRTTLYYLIHQPLGYVDGFLQSLRF
nr:hypothetical protein [Tanacetum cinerariifolium]